MEDEAMDGKIAFRGIKRAQQVMINGENVRRVCNQNLKD